MIMAQNIQAIAEVREIRRVWIVVQAKPAQERLAKDELEHKGFEVYLPMRLFEDRKGEIRATPFFGRYLFARVTLDVERWKGIYTTRGVAGVLGCGMQPHGVNDQVVERIRQQEDGGFIRLGLAEDCLYTKGDRVAVGSIEAVFSERVDSKRVAILVSLLQRADSRVVVDISKLRRL
jgi:transcription antitermination factor NusG